MTLFDLVAKLTLDSSEYEEGLKGARGKIDTFANGLNTGLNKLMKIGAVAWGALSAGATKFASDAIQTGMGFDNAMSQVAATMGTTVDQIQQLRDFAQEMGATTKFTATEAAEALNYMALAGYDAEKSMSMLPTVLNLASAGAMDLARASDMVTDAESALGLTTEETVAMVDQMAKTASKSNTSVEQLGEAMLTIGGTAKFMAGGTDRLATVLGILADNGIKGSEAGTHLRNMLLKLSAPTDAGAKMIAELGLQIYDASGNMRDMQDIILDLGAAMDGMTDQDKINIISELFNARDVAAVNALLNTSVDRWNELGAAIKDSKGAADAMAETQLDNLNGDITIMKSALDGVKIAFSDGITPAIRDVVQRITKALSNPKTSKFLNDVGQKLGELTQKIAHGVGNAIPKLISLFDDGGKKVKIFGAVVGGAALAIKAFVDPIGAAVTALGLFAAALGVSWLAADDAEHRLTSLTQAQWDEIDAAAAAADATENARESRLDAMGAIDEEIQKTRDLWNELQTLVGANGEVIAGNEGRVDYILGELNSALGTEYERNGDIIAQYGEMSAAIDNLIEKRKAERLVAAAQESASAAQEGLDEIQAAYSNRTQQLNEYETALAEANRQLEENTRIRDEIRSKAQVSPEEIEMAREATNAIWEARGRIEELTPLIESTQSELNMLNGQLIDSYTEIGNAERAETELLRGNYDAVAEIFENDLHNRMQHKIEAGAITEELVAEAQHNAQVLADAYQQYVNSSETLGDAFSEETAQKMFEAAQQAQADYQDALAGLQEQQRQAGESAGQEFASGVEGTVDLADAAGGAVAGAAVSAIEAVDTTDAGYNFGAGFAQGIGNSTSLAETAARTLAQNAKAAMENTLQEHSPSKVTDQIGQYFGIGFAQGIDSTMSDVLESASNLADGAVGVLNGAGDLGTVVQSGNDTNNAIIAVLNEIRDKIGGDVVLDSGELVGYMDNALGAMSRRKARAYT